VLAKCANGADHSGARKSTTDAKERSNGKRSHFDYEQIIQEGSNGDRSADFHAVVWHLATLGLSVDQIEARLAKYPNGIAAKYIERLWEEIARSYEKWERAQDGAGDEPLPLFPPLPPAEPYP
jgi:hypothetical protein